ncbi:energy transducer TonB [Variovorax sp. VRV01]|nr:energy transducer TonB [Variovorax sp. VRV01]
MSAVLSVALHVAALSARISPAAPKWAAGDVIGSAASSMQVRTVPLLLPSTSPLPVREPLRPTEALHTSDRAPASTEEPSTNTSPAAPAPSAAVEDNSDSFVPRNQLSTPPVAKTAIVLEPPPGEIAAGRVVGILSLFIDEQGRVQRVDAEESRLPPAFEQAAREAFMAAEFSPGEVDGRAVKSRQRVEVIFEYRPES